MPPGFPLFPAIWEMVWNLRPLRRLLSAAHRSLEGVEASSDRSSEQLYSAALAQHWCLRESIHSGRKRFKATPIIITGRD
jgi:hypothetical protein